MTLFGNDLIALLQGPLWAWFAVFFRVAGTVSVAPGFSHRVVSVRVRLAAAVMFSAVVAPAIAPMLPPPATGLRLSLLLTETLVGLFLGIALRFLVFGLQIAGTIIAQATSLSQILGNAGEPSPAIGQLLHFGGLALAMSAGFHVQAAEYLIRSYDLFPPGQLPLSGAISSWSVSEAGRIFALAFSLSAPFIIASLLYNLTLGAINRAMPQLMVTFIGAPAIAFGGLCLLLLVAPILLTIWLDAFHATLLAPLEAAP